MKRIEPRFKECLECRHFRPANLHKKCRGCDVGENFEEEIEELDPDCDEWFDRNLSNQDDDDE